MADASFTIDIGTTGGSAVDAASKSVETLAAKLDVASAASRAAADAVTAGEAAYRQAASTLDRAEKSVERLGIQADAQRGKLQEAMDTGDTSAIDRAQAKLAALNARQAEAQSKALAARSAIQEQASALDALKATATTAADAESKLAKEVDAAQKKIADEKKETEEMAGTGSTLALERGLGRLPGPLASTARGALSLVTGVEKINKSVGAGLGPYVAAAAFLVALAAAFIALGVAIVAGTIKIGEWAIGLADANRSAELLSQGLVQDVKQGTVLNDKINSLTKTLPLTREEISSTAKSLAQAGLRGKDLTDALERSAIQAAKVKFGPDFEKQMLSLDEQSKVLHANLSSTFGGLKLDNLLGGLQKLGALLDDSTASGRAIKVVFESLFQPMIDGVANAAPKIEAFFLNVEIWTLKALIAIKPYGSKIEELGKAFLYVAGFLTLVAALSVGLLVVALGAVVAVIGAVIFGLIKLVEWIATGVIQVFNFGKAIVDGAVSPLDFLRGKFGEVLAWLGSLSLVDMGRNLIMGLVDGIKGATGALVDGIKGAVQGGIDAAKKALGIHSPSTVFAEIGMNTGAGMAEGVDKSTDHVQSALEGMTAPPASQPGPAQAAPAAPSQGGGKSGGLNLAGATFVLNGVEGAEDAEKRIGGLLTRLLEGDVAQLGAAVPST